MQKQAAFAATDQLYAPLVIGEATGSVTMDTAAAVSYLADVMISFGKTWMPGVSAGLCFKMPRTSLSWWKASRALSLNELKTYITSWPSEKQMQVSARRRKPWQHSSLEVDISAVPCRRMLAGLKMSMQLCFAFNAQHLCSVFFHAKKRPTDHVSINRTLKCTSFTHLYSMSLSGLSFLCCSCLIDNAVLTLTKHSYSRVVIL